jgi:hypothetical protein
LSVDKKLHSASTPQSTIQTVFANESRTFVPSLQLAIMPISNQWFALTEAALEWAQSKAMSAVGGMVTLPLD